MNMWDAHTRFVTVASVSSESGDHFLFTFDDWPDREEIKRMVFEEAPDWWVDEEDVCIDDFVQIRFIE